MKTDEDEEYIYQVHAASVRDSADAAIGTVVIFNDITDIRAVERMKTEFVSIVSHELRTPLTPMKGFIRTLLDGLDEDWYTKEDRREFYGIIEQNVDRLSRLINDLLNVSRPYLIRLLDEQKIAYHMVGRHRRILFRNLH